MLPPALSSRIDQAIDEAFLADLCQRLIQTPTVNPYSGDANPSGEGEGQKLIVGEFEQLGAAIEQFLCDDGAMDKQGVLAPKDRINEGRPNVVATFDFGGDGPTLLLDAHMDTVAVDTYDGDPFSGELCDGFLHGRGASDDKASMTAMVGAARALAGSGLPLHGKLVCCSVVDEECNGAGRGSATCLHRLPRPDAVIVADGDGAHISNGCSGILTAEITVLGKAGHAASAGSVNAIEQAVKLFPAFDQFRDLRGNVPGDFNLGVFQSGTHPANVPNQAILGMNIKTRPEDAAKALEMYGKGNGRCVRELLERCIAEVAAQDAFFQEHPPRIEWIKDLPATGCGDESDWLIAAANRGYVDVLGKELPVQPLGGWGDLSHFQLQGIPTIGVGAGWAGAAHSASEKVAVADIVVCTRMLARVAAEFLLAP
ncbi:MAG: M20/M25/M40 family metallo-hydrolase [Victivallales bacterium]|nr:M20/M25/M40 family metallo-hydrolase [Victivallales bacterium]